MPNGCRSKPERLIATTSQERRAHAEWRVLYMACSEDLQAFAFAPVVVTKLGNIPLLATDHVSVRAEALSRLNFESYFVCHPLLTHVIPQSSPVRRAAPGRCRLPTGAIKDPTLRRRDHRHTGTSSPLRTASQIP